MVPYYVAHNAESEACDLLLEVERVDEIKAYLDKDNFERVCRYLASFANFVPEPEVRLLHTYGFFISIVIVVVRMRKCCKLF